MEKLQAGTMVKHNEFELEGVILGEFLIPDFYFIDIKKGENPVEPSNKHYIAHIENLTVIEEEVEEEVANFEDFLKALFGEEEEAETEEEAEDTFDAEMELPDGTIIRFDTVLDLLYFVKNAGGLQ